MGIGIAVTRGSAASISFCYSLLLLTVSRSGPQPIRELHFYKFDQSEGCILIIITNDRNLITKMKEWAFNQYIPLDSNIIFHKIVACTALFFSVLHSVGY